MLVGLCAAFASSASAAPAQPATVCEGTLSGGPYFGVSVPAGAACTLLGAVVHGDVTAAPGSSLNLTLRSTIIGDVITEGALVQVHLSVVAGSITIVRAPDTPIGLDEVVVAESVIVGGNISVRESTGMVVIDRNQVLNGDISVTSNVVPPFLAYPSELAVRQNHVLGDVTVSENTGPGDKNVSGNRVSGALTCLGNEQPFVGGPNSAGSTAGECF